MKRLKKGKGIKVNCAHGDGEIVRTYIHHRLGERQYEIRLAPAHFVYLPRRDFRLVDSVIKFRTLVELRNLDN